MHGHFDLMDDKRPPSKTYKGKGQGVKNKGRRISERIRRRETRRQVRQESQDCFSQSSRYSGNTLANYAQSSAGSNAAGHRDIPGYHYDPVKNRYFKRSQDHPEIPIVHDQSEVVPIKETKNECFKRIPPSRLHYVRKCELMNTHCPVISKRRGLEEWARHLVKRKHFTLSDDLSSLEFSGVVSNIAVSPKCHKMVAVTRSAMLDSYMIQELYDVNYDKEDFINPKIFATIFSSEVSHVEWNPNEDMDNFFLISLLGSENSTGKGVICKFDDSRTVTCQLDSYPLPNGTAFHCSWCKNPQYSNLLGIGGSKQTVLIDAEKKTSLCRMGSSSDIFCVEFAHKSPVIFFGRRCGDILRADIRGKWKLLTCIDKTQHLSVTSIKMMEDENYLMASHYDGMIKMWDIRLAKPVKEYHGNVNETKLIPFAMDSSQSIIASAGQDGKTRIWSVGSCNLLNTINCPDGNCEHPDVPPVCIGETWGNKRGMKALGIASGDKLHFYY